MSGERKVGRGIIIGTAKLIVSRLVNWLDLVGYKIRADLAQVIATHTEEVVTMRSQIKVDQQKGKAFGRQMRDACYWAIASASFVGIFILAIPMCVIALPVLTIIYITRLIVGSWQKQKKNTI